MKTKINVFDIIFFIIGVILLLLGIYIYMNSVNITKKYVETDGILEKIQDQNGYILVFSLEDLNRVESHSLYNNLVARFDNDKKVRVLYDKNNTNNVAIKSFFSLYLVPLLVFIVALILLIMEIVRVIMAFTEKPGTLKNGQKQHF